MAVNRPQNQKVQAYMQANTPKQPGVRPIKNSHGPAQNKPAANGKVNRPAPTVRIFADGAKFSEANTAYNTAKGNLGKGFVKNPNSPTGWSWVDEFGRMANSRPPARNERVISTQQIQRMNPNFLKAGAGTQAGATPATQTGVSAPWLQGFAGGSGWSQTVDGGWWNGETGQYWKAGQAIPGAPAGGARPISGDQYTSLYASLLKMFEGL